MRGARAHVALSARLQRLSAASCPPPLRGEGLPPPRSHPKSASGAGRRRHSLGSGGDSPPGGVG
eukprot:11436721-Alexandrium_andersonii.AAC.1